MGFLQPLVLFGLAAAAIPALLHLLERRVPPELDFPAVRYLAETERRHARRLKLRHLLLLILRTALVVLVVVAAARPVARGGRAVGGGHEPTALAVVVDNSLSSGAVRDGVRALDRFRALARATVEETTAADRLWLVLADGVVRRESRDALLATIDRLEVDDRRLDLSAAVTAAARAIAHEPLAREVQVVSDLQATALGRAQVPAGVRVLAVEPAPPPANRGVDSATVRDGALAVAIGGTRDASDGAFAVTLGGRGLGRAMAAPGSGATMQLRPPPAGVTGGELRGWMTGEVQLEPDELLGDNRRLFAWRARQPARVRADPGAGSFVAVALQVLADARRVAPGDEVTIATRLAPGITVVLPPADPALVGQLNRTLGARGIRWRYRAGGASAGRIVAADLGPLAGGEVLRRLALTGGDSSDVLAAVSGEPWLVRSGDVVLVGSRFEPEWTPLPATPAFVPFLDVLVNRLARGEALVRSEEGAPAVRFERSPLGDTVSAVVVGHDPRESDLAPGAGDAIRTGLGDQSSVVPSERWIAEGFGGGGRTELTGMIVLLALLVAVAEWGVATLYR
jgi:aerotolerance regulator-like protein